MRRRTLLSAILAGRLVDARLTAFAGYRGDGIEDVGEVVDGETAVVRPGLGGPAPPPPATGSRVRL